MTSRPATNDDASAAAPGSAGAQDFRLLADMARILRRMSAEIGARHFVLCAARADAEAAPLALIMDSACPETSQAARQLMARLPGSLVTRAGASPIPLWWPGSEGGEPAGLDTARWAERVEPVSPAAGLLLPLCSERGQHGLVIFSGDSIAVDPDGLANLHARCFGVFAATLEAHAHQDLPAPSISRRELECLKLAANGHTSEEISRLLGLSVHTANQYLTNTTHKLNAVNRVHALAKAMREGLIG